MIKYIFFFSLFSFTNSIYAAPFQASTVITRRSQTIQIETKIKKIMAKTHPNFKMLKKSDFTKDVQNLFKGSHVELPMFIIGDFNGDNIRDIIALGRENKTFKLIGFISKGKTFKDITVETWSSKKFKKAFVEDGKIMRYLSFLSSNFIDPSKKSKKDGFQIETYMGYTQSYIFNGTNFEPRI